MINLKIKYNDTTAGIEFPCSDSVIASKLMELHASDHEGDPFFVEEVIEPKELERFFEHRFIDLDELNFLAKRMESFSESEMLQFYGAAPLEGHLTVKDLINTTFNLGRYTLIRDLTDMHKVGVTHMLNVHGALTPEELNSPYMETVGKDLICSGKGVPTEFGLVFINEGVEFAEVYDGTTFPEYYYKEALATVRLSHGEKTEYLYLPDDDLAISKALHRLGCQSFEDCNAELEMSEKTPMTIDNISQSVLDGEGIYRLNSFLKVVDKCEDLRKLDAVIEYAKAEDSESLIQFSNRLDDFIVVLGQYNPEGVGRYWIDEVDMLEYDSDLEDYINFAAYGETVMNGHVGDILLHHGYVCLKPGLDLTDILGDRPICEPEPIDVKFYCPLKVRVCERDEFGGLDEALSIDLDGRYADGYEDEVREKLTEYGDFDMTKCFYGSQSTTDKLIHVEWDVESVDGELYGCIKAKLKEPFSIAEENEFKEWIRGQNSDGFGEGFEQRDIEMSDGVMNVSFWHSGNDYFIDNEAEFRIRTEQDITMGGM